MYRQVFLTFIASKKIKAIFHFECVLKHATDFKVTRFALDVCQKFRNRSWNRQTTDTQ